jgi:hypothetical protein
MKLTNQRKFALKTATCLLSLGLGLNHASAESLLFDFGQTNVAAPYLTTDPGHALSTISGSDTAWNPIKTSAANSSLLYGDGSSASGITLTLGQEASAGNNIISYSTAIANLNLAGTGGAVAGQQKLLTTGSIYGDDNASTAVGRDGFFGSGSGANGNAIGLRIDGLAAGDYLIYVMARNVNSDAASVPMNIFASAGALAGTFDFSALTGTTEANTGYASATYAGQYSTFQAGENYVGLDVTVGVGDSIFVAVDGASAGETRGFLNQLQITTTPAPEPATLALLGLGILALVPAFRKRQRVTQPRRV